MPPMREVSEGATGDSTGGSGESTAARVALRSGSSTRIAPCETCCNSRD